MTGHKDDRSKEIGMLSFLGYMESEGNMNLRVRGAGNRLGTGKDCGVNTTASLRRYHELPRQETLNTHSVNIQGARLSLQNNKIVWMSRQIIMDI